jgi:hypothetical protein
MIAGPFLIIRNRNKVDANATAFLQVTGITDPVISSAINTLCIQLKQAGLWNNIYMLKPYVGGTAVTHSYNLVNTALYQSAYLGGVTHNANGVTYNGTNGYQNHNFNPNTVGINKNSFAYSIYSSTTTLTGTNPRPLGITNASTTTISDFWVYFSSGTYNFYGWDVTNTGISSNFLGLKTVQRISGTQKDDYRNAVLGTTQNINVDTQALPNTTFFEGAVNQNGSPSSYAGFNCRLTCISLSRTAAEELTFYNIIQQFQTTLGRQV